MPDDLFDGGRILDELLGTSTDEETREALTSRLARAEGRAGTVFMEEGKPNDRLWFLLEGEAVVERRRETTTIPIATLSAPGIFGATTFFRPSSATATVRARTDCRILTLDRSRYEAMRESNPRAAEVLTSATLRTLSERFDLLDQRFTEILFRQASEQNRSNEWTRFRSRLFEKPNII